MPNNKKLVPNNKTITTNNSETIIMAEMAIHMERACCKHCKNAKKKIHFWSLTDVTDGSDRNTKPHNVHNKNYLCL